MSYQNPDFQRARLLLSQSRPELAVPHLRAVLAADPDFAPAHALLALCHSDGNRPKDALFEAERAVGLEPTEAFNHFVLSRALNENDRPKESLAAIKRAIEIDPADAMYWARLAAELHDQHCPTEALEAAQTGLEVDPNNSACEALRGLILRRMGRTTESESVVRQALAQAPESSVAHANLGMTLLHQRKPHDAIEHFKEALRLDPNSEWARDGLVEALRARSRIYRFVLGFFLWMQRFSPRVQMGITLGGYIAYRVLLTVSHKSPTLAPFVTPLIWAYLIFAVMTWLAVPLANLTLLPSRLGRLSLRRIDRWMSLALAGGLLIALGTLLLGVALKSDVLQGQSLPLLVGCIPIAVAGFPMSPGVRRYFIIWAGIAYGVMALCLVPQFLEFMIDRGYFGNAVFACVLTPLVSNFIPAVRNR